MSLLQWIGGSSNRFNDKLNWNPQATPGVTSDVVIAPASPITIAVANATINSLADNASTTLAIAATDSFTIVGAKDAANPSGASVNQGTITLGSAADLFLSGKLTNSGSLSTAAASDVWINNLFVNTGSIHQHGDVTLGDATHVGTARNAAGGAWSIAGAVDIMAGAAAGSHLTNAGTIARAGVGVSDVGVATSNSGKVSVSSGALEFLSAVANVGTMTASGAGASLWLNKAVSGVGTLDIGGGAALHLGPGADAGQTVDFMAATSKETLDLASPGSFAGHISGFAANDWIDLLHTASTSESFSGGVLTVFNGSTAVAHLNMVGSYSTASFHLVSDNHGGTLIHV